LFYKAGNVNLSTIIAGSHGYSQVIIRILLKNYTYKQIKKTIAHSQERFCLHTQFWWNTRS
jgi:hypothetical protein